VFGIWENGFVFWDFHGGGVWHRIDGWMGAHDEAPKRQKNCKGMGDHGFCFQFIHAFDFFFLDSCLRDGEDFVN